MAPWGSTSSGSSRPRIRCTPASSRRLPPRPQPGTGCGSSSRRSRASGESAMSRRYAIGSLEERGRTSRTRSSVRGCASASTSSWPLAAVSGRRIRTDRRPETLLIGDPFPPRRPRRAGVQGSAGALVWQGSGRGDRSHPWRWSAVGLRDARRRHPEPWLPAETADRPIQTFVTWAQVLFVCSGSTPPADGEDNRGATPGRVLGVDPLGSPATVSSPLPSGPARSSDPDTGGSPSGCCRRLSHQAFIIESTNKPGEPCPRRPVSLKRDITRLPLQPGAWLRGGSAFLCTDEAGVKNADRGQHSVPRGPRAADLAREQAGHLRQHRQ